MPRCPGAPNAALVLVAAVEWLLRRPAEPRRRDHLVGPDPVVRELDPVSPVDCLVKPLRPEMLHEDERGRHVCGERLRDAEHIVLVEEVAVGELRGAGYRPS